MNVKTPRQQKSMEIKDRILDAAVALVQEHGYQALTIKNICRQAEVSNGSFYHFFKTKDELMTYYLVKGRQSFLESNQQPNGDIRRMVTEIYLSYVDYCEQTGLEFIANYYSTQNQALNNYASFAKGSENVSSYDDVVALMQKAQADGWVTTSYSPECMADEVCMIIKGIIFNWCVTEGRIGMREYVERLLGYYFNNIVTERHREKYGQYRPCATDAVSGDIQVNPRRES